MKRQKGEQTKRLKAKKTKSRKDKNTKGQIVIKSKRPPSIRIQAPPALGHGDPSVLKKEWRCTLKTEKETAAGEEHTELFFFQLSARSKNRFD